MSRFSFYQSQQNYLLQYFCQMSHSRSGSRGSLESWIANRPKQFRTIHRNRSNHQQAQVNGNRKKMENANDLNTESRLQKLLSLTPSKNDYRQICSSISSGRKSQVKRESQLSNRSRVVESHLSRKSYRQIGDFPNKPLEQKLNSDSKGQISSRLKVRMMSSFSHLSKNSQTQTSKPEDHPEDVDLQSIEAKLNELINRKLKLLHQNVSSLQDMNQSGFASKAFLLDQQLQELLQTVMKIKTAKEYSSKEEEVINKRIEYIENLLAENSTELQLMRKRYFGSAARKSKTLDLEKSKIKLASDCLSIFEKEQRNPVLRTEGTPAKGSKHWYLNQRSTSSLEDILDKTDFRVPNPEDYESFRFKSKPASVNRQPLPRSSYKRDYLNIKSEPSEKIVAKDNNDVFPKFFYDMASMYSKQYKQYKAQIFNHKEMDACRDKLKVINFSYAPKKKGEAVMRMREGNRKKQVESGILSKLPLSIKSVPIAGSQTEGRLGKLKMVSEAKRQFIWGSNSSKSRIKHQHLKQFQYRLKNLYKA